MSLSVEFAAWMQVSPLYVMAYPPMLPFPKGLARVLLPPQKYPSSQSPVGDDRPAVAQ